MTNDSMISRVAKAIEKCRHDYRDAWREKYAGSSYAELPQPSDEEIARAALEALMEPTDAVRLAAYCAASKSAWADGRMSWDADIDRAWQAAITTALNDKD